MAHAPAPPALALTPPNLCVLEGVADPSALLRFWEPERVWLASEFPPGRQRGPGEHWGSPPHPWIRALLLEERAGEQRWATAGRGTRCTPPGLFLFAGWSRRAAGKGYPAEPCCHSPDSQKRYGRTAGRTEEPCTLPNPFTLAHGLPGLGFGNFSGDSGFWQLFGFHQWHWVSDHSAGK